MVQFVQKHEKGSLAISIVILLISMSYAYCLYDFTEQVFRFYLASSVLFTMKATPIVLCLFDMIAFALSCCGILVLSILCHENYRNIAFFTLCALYIPTYIYWQRGEGLPIWLQIVLAVFSFLVIYAVFFPKQKETPNGREKLCPVDRLGRKWMYDNICDYIIESSKRVTKGRAIGIFGGWGSGKSHLLEYLQYRLSDPQNSTNRRIHTFRVCRVNLWEQSTLKDAWESIANVLDDNLEPEEGSGFISRMLSFVPLLSMFYPQINSSFEDVKKLILRPEDGEHESLCKEISERIPKNERLVLILDDVERSPLKIIRHFFSLVERLKGIERLIIICAIAEEEIGSLYSPNKLNLSSISGYFSKIFDARFNLPDLDSAEMNNMVNHLIETKYSDTRFLQPFIQYAQLKFDTPRQIERVLESLATVERLYFDWEKETRNNTEKMCLEYYAFLMEILRVIYPSVLEDIRKILPEDIRNHTRYFAKWLDAALSENSSGKDMISPHLLDLIKKDRLLYSVLDCLKKNDDLPYIQQAIAQDHLKRMRMSEKDVIKLIADYKKEIPLSQNIREKYIKDNLLPLYVQRLAGSFMDYIFDHITENVNVKMLNDILKEEKNLSQVDQSNLQISQKHIERIVIRFLDGKKIDQDTYDDYLKVLSYASIDEIKKAISDNIAIQNDCDAPTCNDMNKPIIFLYKVYAKILMQEILKSSTRVPKNNLDIIDPDNYYLSEDDVLNTLKSVIKSETVKLEKYRKVLDYMTKTNVIRYSSSTYPDDGEEYMAVSKNLFNIFLPWLDKCKKWFQENGIKLGLEEYVRLCEEAVEYYKKTATNASVGQEYLEVAEQLRTHCLEVMSLENKRQPKRRLTDQRR